MAERYIFENFEKFHMTIVTVQNQKNRELLLYIVLMKDKSNMADGYCKGV